MTVNRHTALFATVTVVIGVVMTFFIPLRVDEAGINFIKGHEAFVPCPYYDQGRVPTIGYGMTHYHDHRRVTMDDRCLTRAEADFHLRRILSDYEYTVHDYVEINITQAQFNALTSFCYNVGINAFKRSNLLKRVNNNPTDPLIITEFYKWVYVKGRVSKGLTYRRQAEIELYFSEEFLFPDSEPVVSYFRPDTILIN